MFRRHIRLGLSLAPFAAAVKLGCTAGGPLRDPSAATVRGSLWSQRQLFSTTSVLFKMRPFKGRKKLREAKPGDWTCQCGAVNGRIRRECIKCNAPAPPLPPGVVRPKMPGEDPNDWACPCGQMNYRGNVNCHKCSMPKPAPPPVPGTEVTLWTCKRCKGVNRSFRKFCFNCGAPPS